MLYVFSIYASEQKMRSNEGELKAKMPVVRAIIWRRLACPCTWLAFRGWWKDWSIYHLPLRKSRTKEFGVTDQPGKVYYEMSGRQRTKTLPMGPEGAPRDPGNLKGSLGMNPVNPSEVGTRQLVRRSWRDLGSFSCSNTWVSQAGRRCGSGKGEATWWSGHVSLPKGDDSSLGSDRKRRIDGKKRNWLIRCKYTYTGWKQCQWEVSDKVA